MKQRILAILLAALASTTAWAVPQVTELAVDSSETVQLEMVCDSEPIQAVALESRANENEPWHNVAIWNWDLDRSPGQTVHLSTAMKNDDSECRVLFFGASGLLQVQTFQLQPVEEERALGYR